jgi:hypothetical protein
LRVYLIFYCKSGEWGEGGGEKHGYGKKTKRERNKGELPLLAIHWELGNIPSTGGDALSQTAKNFLKVQTAHANLNVVPNIVFSQRTSTGVLRHGLTFALRLSLFTRQLHVKNPYWPT